jgi:DnaJ-class molecular chaperone
LHLDKHAFTVASKPNQIIQPDEWIIIKGEGMPKRGNPTEFGDMHVKMKVRLPATLT